MKVEQPDIPELKEFVCRGLDAGEWIYVQAPNTGAAAQLYVDSACEPVTTTYWEDVEVTEIKRRVDAPMTWDTAEFTEGSKLAEWQNILRDKVAVVTPEWDGEHWLVNLDGVEEEHYRVISLYLEHANRGTWEYGSLQHSFIWTSPPNFLIKYPVIIPERPQIHGIHGREFTQLPDRTWSVKGPIHPDMHEGFARGLAKATGGTWNFSIPFGRYVWTEYPAGTYMEPVDEEVLDYLSWTEVKVAIHPKEPECFNDKPHTWKSPYEIVGGIEENPGVWGSGGGVRTHECCMQCGCERVTNTWTQDPNDGSEGHVCITYRKNEYLEQVHNLMLSKRGEEIKAVLSDYGPVSTRPGELIVALESLGDEGEEDDLLDALREKLPGWASADWTGNSGTDKYGDTTWDVRVVWNVE